MKHPYVTFEKENHIYTIHQSKNGEAADSFASESRVVPSVTQIIQENNLGFDFSQIKNLDLSWYGDRGTKVHKACEYFDQKRLDWNTVDLKILGYIKSYQLGQHHYKFEILKSEMMVFDRLERYAGMLDRIVNFDRSAGVNHGVAQIDIKSGKPHPSHGYQTAGYNNCLDGVNAEFNKHIPRYCLYLNKDGEMPELRAYSSLNDFVIFESALNCSIARNSH